MHRFSLRISRLCVVVAMCAILLCTGCSSGYVDIVVNKELQYTRPFSLQPRSGDLDTKIEGTIFIFGEHKNTRYASLTTTFYLNPEDRDGILIFFPEGVNLKSVDWDYRYEKESLWNHSYVSVWQSAYGQGKNYSYLYIGQANDDEPPSGGGAGTLVAEFDFNEEDLTGSDGSEVHIFIGKNHSYSDSENHVYIDIADK